jgi:hypothetical protein
LTIPVDLGGGTLELYRRILDELACGKMFFVKQPDKHEAGKG